jgi:hypothetical protein
MYIRTCIDRSAIVALSAEPPGVNELCVCVLPSHAMLVISFRLGHLYPHLHYEISRLYLSVILIESRCPKRQVDANSI